ncbi:MAG: OmpA family protein [Bacteroidia bacterium]|nr:OmpA family protein [Bacteroidia bacterium]
MMFRSARLSYFFRTATILFLVALLVTASQVFAQSADEVDTTGLRYGGFINYSLNMHSADFQKLPGIPNCCPRFETGDGGGFAIGGMVEWPFADSFAILFRLGYHDYSALLTDRENILVNVNGEAVPGVFEHSIDASLAALIFEPLVAWKLFGAFSLLAGPNLGYVLTKSFEQAETIVEPSDVGVFFNEQRRTRNEFSGDIPDAGTLTASFLAGARYEVPLNESRTLMAAPEVLYSIGLLSVADGLNWYSNSLRLGVGVLYRPESGTPEEKPLPPPPPPPPPPPAPPALSADINAVALAADGSEQPIATIRVEEFISTEMRPLLHYVFFDENSAQLPERYERLTPARAASFDVLSVKDRDILGTYHNILNIIGRRLTQYPEATLQLTGTNTDAGVEAGNLQLSRGRADAVKEYLLSAWNIASERITVDARGLPEKPSNVSDPDGIEENRRVEIVSTDPRILDPVVIDDTLRTVNPPVILYKPEVESQAGVTSWLVSVRQDGTVLKSFDGRGDVPRVLEWQVERERNSIPRGSASLTYRIDVTDAAAQQASSPLRSLPIEQLTVQKKRRERLGDKEIDRYNLILFEFNSEELGDRNRRIAGMIKPRIAANATVSITGYTDRIGELSVNEPLSLGRARSAALALGQPLEKATGLGETNMYTNDLPEGRFYCRTVSIVVETPVE